MCQSSASLRTWSKTPGKLWKVGETADGGARENPVFPPFLRLAAASIKRCCTCVPGVFDQMPRHRGLTTVPGPPGHDPAVAIAPVEAVRVQVLEQRHRVLARGTELPAGVADQEG